MGAPWNISFQRMGNAFRARFFRDADGGLTSGAIDDSEQLQALFNKWNAEVKAAVDPSRLLIFEVSQGWEPLCAFLGVPVPDVPFPRVNDTTEMKERIRAAHRHYIAYDLAIAAGVLAVGAMAMRRMHA